MDTKRNIEHMLYNYYKNKKRIDWLKYSLQTTERAIEKIQYDLKNVNVELKDYISAVDYSRDRVQNDNYTSLLERELMRATEALLEELKLNVQKKFKLKQRIRRIEKAIEVVERVLKDLAEEEEQIIQLKYGEGLTVRQIETKLELLGMPFSKTTIWRKKDKILEYLCEQLQ